MGDDESTDRKRKPPRRGDGGDEPPGDGAGGGDGGGTGDGQPTGQGGGGQSGNGSSGPADSGGGGTTVTDPPPEPPWPDVVADGDLPDPADPGPDYPFNDDENPFDDDELGGRRQRLDPSAFEPPSGYKRRQMFPSDDPPAQPPKPPQGDAGSWWKDLPGWVGPAAGTAVVGGLIIGGVFLFGGSSDDAPADTTVAVTAAAEGSAEGSATAEETVSEDQGALDTLPPGTLGTLPPGTLETLPTATTVPPTTTAPPTTVAQEQSNAESCAQAADELAEVIRALFDLVAGKTVQEAANDLAAINGFDAQVTPILERGRQLGCTADDIQLICDGLADIVPNGEASELAYEALTARCE